MLTWSTIYNFFMQYIIKDYKCNINHQRK